MRQDHRFQRKGKFQDGQKRMLPVILIPLIVIILMIVIVVADHSGFSPASPESPGSPPSPGTMVSTADGDRLSSGSGSFSPE